MTGPTPDKMSHEDMRQVVEIGTKIEALVERLRESPRCRQFSLAITKLEEAQLWIVHRLQESADQKD